MSRDDRLHLWFGLSYANYLTIPRSLMQEMPLEWRDKMAALLEEMGDTWTWPCPFGTRIEVRLRDAQGKYRDDPLREYRHPDEGAIELARTRPLTQPNAKREG